MTVSGRSATVYSIAGGHVGRNRLRVLSGVLAPTTAALFDQLHIPGTARCLDAGCGGGDVTTLLAQRALRGHVTGIDIDPVKIALATTDAPANVSYRTEDLATTVQRREQFDIVYARFVLCHLSEAGSWVKALTQLVAPGGTLAVEDTHIAGSFCAPPLAAFARCNEIYSATVRANGGDPDIGPSLPAQLAKAGLEEIGIQVVQPAALHGDAKRIQLLTLAAIKQRAIQSGTGTAEEIAEITADLEAFAERTDTVVSTAQIIQTWGRRPATPATSRRLSHRGFRHDRPRTVGLVQKTSSLNYRTSSGVAQSPTQPPNATSTSLNITSASHPALESSTYRAAAGVTRWLWDPAAIMWWASTSPSRPSITPGVP